MNPYEPPLSEPVRCNDKSCRFCYPWRYALRSALWLQALVLTIGILGVIVALI